jgi:hypothetical protein
MLLLQRYYGVRHKDQVTPLFVFTDPEKAKETMRECMRQQRAFNKAKRVAREHCSATQNWNNYGAEVDKLIAEHLKLDPTLDRYRVRGRYEILEVPEL